MHKRHMEKDAGKRKYPQLEFEDPNKKKKQKREATSVSSSDVSSSDAGERATGKPTNDGFIVTSEKAKQKARKKAQLSSDSTSPSPSDAPSDMRKRKRNDPLKNLSAAKQRKRDAASRDASETDTESATTKKDKSRKRVKGCKIAGPQRKASSRSSSSSSRSSRGLPKKKSKRTVNQAMTGLGSDKDKKKSGKTTKPHTPSSPSHLVDEILADDDASLEQEQNLADREVEVALQGGPGNDAVGHEEEVESIWTEVDTNENVLEGDSGKKASQEMNEGKSGESAEVPLVETPMLKRTVRARQEYLKLRQEIGDYDSGYEKDDDDMGYTVIRKDNKMKRYKKREDREDEGIQYIKLHTLPGNIEVVDALGKFFTESGCARATGINYTNYLFRRKDHRSLLSYLISLHGDQFRLQSLLKFFDKDSFVAVPSAKDWIMTWAWPGNNELDGAQQ